VLFIYVLLVAFLFVKVLGADVIGDSGVPKKKKKRRRDLTAQESGEVAALEMMGGAH
jgi:multiple sugar transport system permease protein